MKNLLARLALLGSIAAFLAAASSAFAQDKPPAAGAEATPAATAPAAPAAPAAAPAGAPKCGDKGFDCNKGDVAWMLTSTAFVLLMTVPGLALFYAGMARTKNALSTAMQSFSIFCIVAVLWVIYGYSVAFTAGSGPFWGSLDKLFMLGEDPATAVAATFSKGQYLPDFVYCMFQLTFAAITVALITGGPAERFKFSALVIFSILWFTFAYLPVAHMVWYWDGPDAYTTAKAADVANSHAGYIFQKGALDFAGGTVVHVKAGIAWTLTEWIAKGKPSLLGICSGIVAGLVAITPAAGYVGPVGAFVTCAIAGVLCCVAVTKVKAWLGYDDSLDTFGVHCIGGIIGSLGTGTFVNPTFGGTGVYDYVANKVGDFDAMAQIISQLWDIGITLVWSGGVAFVILLILKFTIGIRASDEAQEEGLDLADHGEKAYNY